MMVSERGTALVFRSISQSVLAASREMPGRRRWRDGELWVEASGENLRFLLERLPALADAGLRTIDDFLTAEGRAAEVKFQKTLPPEASAFMFKTPPYDHQLKAFGLCRAAEYFGLFMEMGTGKTKVLIDNAASLFAEGYVSRVIVVSPPGVHRQWVEEQLPLHIPDLPWGARTWVAGGGKRWRAEWEAACDRPAGEGLEWFSFGYPSLASSRAQQDLLRALLSGDTLLILDESQNIKTPGAKRTKFLMKVAASARFRRIATGTEVTQGLEDLYTQLKFLHPRVLDQNSFFAFRSRYCLTAPVPGAPAGAVRIVGYQNQEDLKDRIAGCTFRVRKEDCLDLPPKQYLTRQVDLGSEQARHYKTLTEDMLAALESGELIEAPLAITRMMKLQQVLSGFLMDEVGTVHDLPCPRIDAAVDAIAEAGGRGIVWSRFRRDIERLREAFEARGLRAGTYYGDTTEAERRRVTKPGEVDVLVANPASAGTGLNLAHFDVALYYANSFNAAERWQSEDRIHRIGQKNHCRYIDLIAPGTMDPKIIEALRRKRDVARSIAEVREALEC